MAVDLCRCLSGQQYMKGWRKEGRSLGDRNQAGERLGSGEEGAGRMRNEGDAKQTLGGDDSVALIFFASPKDLT